MSAESSTAPGRAVPGLLSIKRQRHPGSMPARGRDRPADPRTAAPWPRRPVDLVLPFRRPAIRTRTQGAAASVCSAGLFRDAGGRPCLAAGCEKRLTVSHTYISWARERRTWGSWMAGRRTRAGVSWTAEQGLSRVVRLVVDTAQHCRRRRPALVNAHGHALDRKTRRARDPRLGAPSPGPGTPNQAAATDPGMPRGVRVRLAVLLGYLALPIDLIPDFIPVVGYADDAIVIAIVLRSVTRAAGPAVLDRHWPGTPEGLAAVRRLCRLPDGIGPPPK